VRIEDYVHAYYSIERFKATYQFDIYPMVDREQWPEVDLAFVMVPLKLERPAGRPRVRRIKSSDEPGKRGPYQCKRCFQFGHIEKTYREPPAELDEELPPLPKTRLIFKLFYLFSFLLFTLVTWLYLFYVGKEKVRLPLRGPRVLPYILQRNPGQQQLHLLLPASPSSTSQRPITRANISPGGIARRVIIS
jgi:hypothetical protein